MQKRGVANIAGSHTRVDAGRSRMASEPLPPTEEHTLKIAAIAEWRKAIRKEVEEVM